MKILFPIGSFYPAQSGGPNNSIAWLSKTLNKHGVETIIVTTDYDIKQGTIKINNWLNTEYGSVFYAKTKIYYLPLKMLREVFKVIKKVDVIHLTGFFYPPSFIIFLFNKIFYKKPIVWSIRGELGKEAIVYNSTLKKTYLRVIKIFGFNSVFFHATSDEEYSLIQQHLKINSIIKLPNYIIPMPRLIGDGKHNYLLFIGRIHPKKAIENLISGVKLSPLFMKSDYCLKIAGNGDINYTNSLKKLVRALKLDNKVEFIGHIEKKQKELLYANAFITIMPSHNENFGNVVIESLAQGTPVLASKGTPWKILETNNAGFWISNSPIEISKTLDILFEMPKKKYLTMRKNSFSLMNNEFNINTQVGKWINQYKKISI